MSLHYLGYRKFYVKSDINVVFLVNKYETYADCNYLQFSLIPIAYLDDDGEWEFVNEEMANLNDLYDWVNQYFFEESLYDALESECYEILKEIPDDLKPLIKQFEEENL